MPWPGGKLTRALEVGQVTGKVSRMTFRKSLFSFGILALVADLACGPPPRSGSGMDRSRGVPSPQQVVPGLSEPSTAYRDMGFFAQGRPVPFVGNADFFASAVPESTVVLLSLSLANNALSFQ